MDFNEENMLCHDLRTETHYRKHGILVDKHVEQVFIDDEYVYDLVIAMFRTNNKYFVLKGERCPEDLQWREVIYTDLFTTIKDAIKPFKRLMYKAWQDIGSLEKRWEKIKKKDLTNQ